MSETKIVSVLITLKVPVSVTLESINNAFKQEIYFGTEEPVYPAVEEIKEL
jgi:hypothetical protein